jgi:hypothetical protein
LTTVLVAVAGLDEQERVDPSTALVPHVDVMQTVCTGCRDGADCEKPDPFDGHP